MTRKTSLALAFSLVLAAAGNAKADDITIESTRFVPALTRAEVQAELQQYRGCGLDPWAPDYQVVARFRSDRSRADVTAEYLWQRDTWRALNGEDSGSMYLARREKPFQVQPQYAALGE